MGWEDEGSEFSPLPYMHFQLWRNRSQNMFLFNIGSDPSQSLTYSLTCFRENPVQGHTSNLEIFLYKEIGIQ
jgi:hypothetical protein